MKVILTTLNSKYIHTSHALYLLDSAIEDICESHVKEFTIKDNIERVTKNLISYQADLICFAIYIWNVKETLKVIEVLRETTDVKVCVGGPEVSYDVKHFVNKTGIDFLVSGEGEEMLRELIQNKLNATSLNIATKEHPYATPNQVNLNWLETLNSPYRKLKDINNRLVYFESSRGCPYQCSFCLSSLEKGVRFFSTEYLKKELLYLIEHDVKTVKFLDRTFNTKLSFAKELFDFIIAHYKEGQTFQFEITGDILPTEIILYLNEKAPKGLFRFEIGIQSTNQETNNLVDRNQDLDILLENIRLIQEANVIDLHLDLIAGLPKESYHSFEKTFNDIFQIKPLELQLGFLKMLRGTKIRNQADLYGYHFDQESPYEITKHDDLSEEDIFNIHLAEEGLEKYWNKHKTDRTIHYLVSIKKNYFQLFYEIGRYWFDHYQRFTNFQQIDLYERLYLYAKSNNYDATVVLDLLKFDYLTNAKTKPKRFYQTIDKKERNHLFRQIMVYDSNYHIDDLFKYSYLEILTLDPITMEKEQMVLVVTYKQQTTYRLFKLKKLL